MSMDPILAEVLEDFADSLAPDDIDLEAQQRDDAPRFVPVTPEQFDWAYLKRQPHLDAAERLEALKRHELDHLAAQFDKRITAERNAAAFWTDMIERGVWAIEPDSKGKRGVKTAMLSASVTHRTEWQWPAEDAPEYDSLMEWARSNEAVRIKESLDRNAIKARVKETGEQPPGVEVVPIEKVSIR